MRIASSGAQKPTKSDSDVDNAHEFLKAGAKVRKSAAGDTAEAYEKIWMMESWSMMTRSWGAPSQSSILLSQRSITLKTPLLTESVQDRPQRLVCSRIQRVQCGFNGMGLT